MQGQESGRGTVEQRMQMREKERGRRGKGREKIKGCRMVVWNRGQAYVRCAALVQASLQRGRSTAVIHRGVESVCRGEELAWQECQQRKRGSCGKRCDSRPCHRRGSIGQRGCRPGSLDNEGHGGAQLRRPLKLRNQVGATTCAAQQQLLAPAWQGCQLSSHQNPLLLGLERPPACPLLALRRQPV